MEINFNMSIQLIVKLTKSGVVVAMFFLGFNQNLSSQSIYFVNSSSLPGGDGQSWGTAFNDLQDALDSACLHTPSEIWVAAGIYYPTQNPGDTTIGPLDRLNSFSLCSQVALYGGFIGNETQLEERDWIVNPTILSGDIDRNDSLSNNVFNVITYNLVDSSSLLDGFTITGGNGDKSESPGAFIPDGGGMHIEFSEPIIKNCIIWGNVSSEGGGISNDSSGTTLINCTFMDNLAAGVVSRGGAIVNYSSKLNATNCIFSGNASSFSGGAISSSTRSSVVLHDCNFLVNTSGRGAAVYSNSSSSSSMTNCHFTENVAGSSGGAIYANDHSNSVLSHCSFTGNDASSGGGFYNSYSKSQISNCSFSNNHAYSGGVIDNSSAWIEVINSTFNNNLVDGDGGVISNSRALCNLTNCILKGNKAEGNGGALYNNSTSQEINNSTFSGNEAGEEGGAIYNDASFPLITNSIIWNNLDMEGIGSSSASIYNDGTSGALITNSLIANSGGSENWNDAFGKDGGFNIDADPDFVEDVVIDTIPNNTGDLHLQVTSTAINTGTPDTTGLTLPSTDPDGNNRIAHGRIDMGAFEFQDATAAPECNISGPQDVSGFTSNEYSAPAGMASYTWSISGHGEIITATDIQDISVKAGAVTSYLLTLSVTDVNALSSTCALKIDIEPDCNFYDTVQVLFVKTNAIGANTGVSWDDAFTELRDALALSCSGPGEIWVAEGTYTPTAFSYERDISFRLKNGVNIFGGFTGNEMSSGERNWVDHPVILSGDIDRDIFTTDNSFNVVNGSNVNNSSRLDGFTIAHGFSVAELDETFPQASGGGMYNVNCNAIIANCIFSENNVYGNGGGMCNISSSPFLDNCSFIDNTSSSGKGGGIFNTDQSAPYMRYCTFSNNVSFLGGGGIANVSSSPVLTNCVFEANEVIISFGDGGGMYNLESSPLIFDCYFNRNKVHFNRGSGGGIYNGRDSSPNITSTAFIGNTGNEGAGMFNERNASPVILGCFFIENRTSITGKGGGMHNTSGASPWVENCTFTHNTGRTSGGGMYNENASPIVDGCTFRGNIATENEGGGGMTNDHSNSKIYNCLFDADTSYLYGGGMYNINGSTVEMRQCRFTNNYAGAGAGFYAEDDTLSIVQSCSFSHNLGLAVGGGAEVFGSMTFRNCTFSDNRSDAHGGAVYLLGNTGAEVRLVNCSFTGNSAGKSGGGIYHSGDLMSLINCTMSGNDADLDGGALYKEFYSSARLTNCIVWNNRAANTTNSTSASIFIDSLIPPEISYSLIANSGGSQNWNNDIGNDLGNNIDVDPAFVQDIDFEMLPDSNGDLRLLIASPAINAGTPDTTGLVLSPLDLDGNERIHQSRIDMGAYEFQGIVAVPHIEYSKQDIHFFPNPANHSIHLISLEESGDLTIIDMNGRLVLDKHNITLNPDTGYEVDISDFLPGLYVIHFESNGRIKSDQKFMVLHDQ